MLPDRPWELQAVCRLLVLLFMGMCGGNLIVQGAGEQISAALNVDDVFLFHVVAFVSVQGLGLIWIWLFLREHGTSWPEGFGFGNSPLRSISSAFVVTLIALPVATIVIGKLIMLLLELVEITPAAQTTVAALQQTRPVWQIVVLGIAAVVLAPLAEEAIFRGVLYPTLKQRGYPRLALWGTAFLFGAIHFNLATLLPLTFLALVFTWLYERTQNLLAPIVGHCLFNGLNFWALVHPPKWLEKFLSQ